MKNILYLTLTFAFTFFIPLFLLVYFPRFQPEPPILLLYPDKIYPLIIPQTATSIHSIINLAAKKYSISPLLIESVIKIESDFQQFAQKPEPSKHGISMGLMQVMSFNATNYPCHLKQESDLFNAALNVDCGTAMLKQALDHTNTLLEALIAYNGGLGCSKIPNCRKQGTIHANKVMLALSKAIIKNS